MIETVHRELGLTDDEAASIDAVLGRRPNHLELAMYAVMWSEHCSYKSSRVHLRRLPTEGRSVLVGPGENAGVIDAGDGVAVAVRIESHNHPSAVEPYQGAATGVGGILRDIFAMGARPIATMDSLRFGPLHDSRNRWLMEGVVSGIAGYGNSVGVPTVGGETAFDDCFSANPLVNVMSIGVMPKDRLVLGRASGVGNLGVLLGASTGRDGIGGVSVLASAGFGGGQASVGDKRPSVQVGDPFEEKRLIEACLELLELRVIVGIQDLGGGGLTCATSETAARAGLGMDVNLAAVPLREPAMEPFEIMTSESQERMLAIVAPEDLESLREVCDRWEVDASVVARVTAPNAVGELRVLDAWDGPVLAHVPAASLAEGAPLCERPAVVPVDVHRRRGQDPAVATGPSDCGSDILAMLGDPSWVYRQYDHQLFLNTVIGPGGDATVLRLEAPGVPRTGKGLAVSTDGCARWCALDPRRGAAMAVAEGALNVACSGADPVAVVNCLNFGNPEHPQVMWQLSEAVDGIADACTALGLAVVGGNVSLYNESDGKDIDPTPVIGVLGLIKELSARPPVAALAPGASLVLLGRCDPNLGGSRWAAEVAGHREGTLPLLDLAAHSRLVGHVAALARNGPVEGIHDVSDGGLGLSLAEMAVASGTGFRVSNISGRAELFSESASRVVICTREPGHVIDHARAAGLQASLLGESGGRSMVADGLFDLAVTDASERWRQALPSLVGAGPPT